MCYYILCDLMFIFLNHSINRCIYMRLININKHRNQTHYILTPHTVSLHILYHKQGKARLYRQDKTIKARHKAGQGKARLGKPHQYSHTLILHTIILTLYTSSFLTHTCIYTAIYICTIS